MKDHERKTLPFLCHFIMKDHGSTTSVFHCFFKTSAPVGRKQDVWDDGGGFTGTFGPAARGAQVDMMDDEELLELVELETREMSGNLGD